MLPRRHDRDRFIAIACLAVWAAFWLATAIDPWHPRDWLLESLLPFVSVPCLVAMQRRRPFPATANLALLVFLCLHGIGAHYTYAEVPYERWARSLLGISINELTGWTRNHFDRVVHLLYGLLVMPAARVQFSRRIVATPRMIALIGLQFIVATSALYEVLEWATAMLVDPGLGMAYLGTQGDIWDTHRDMALAAVGAALQVVGAALFRPARPIRRPAPAPRC